MKKNSKLLIMLMILLLVYISVILLIPFNHETNFWVAFGLSLFEYFISAGTIIYIICFNKKSLPLFNMVSVRNSGIFGVLTLILNVVIMVIEICPLWLILVLNIIAIAIHILLMITSISIQDSEYGYEEEKKQKINVIKDICIKVEGLEVRTENDILKIQLGKIIEILKYSDPITPEEVKPMDEKLFLSVSLLENQISLEKYRDAELSCNDIILLLQERKKICKLYK